MPQHLVQALICFQLLSAVYSIIPLDQYSDLSPFKEYFCSPEAPAILEHREKFKPISPNVHARRNEKVETFDFIVVGSGPAGCVIANRLTENEDWSVLLLEVGEVPTNLTDIPAIANSFLSTDYNWAFKLEPQENAALGIVNRTMNWPRGRVLGGSSTINALIHIRGNRRDYDRWADAGNEGWSFEDVLPYFKKSEDFLVDFQDPGYHQLDGYLSVDDVPYRSESARAFVQAMQEYGYDYVDYNGAEQIGVSFVHGTIRNGRRSGAYNDYLAPFQNRPNLNIYTNAMATKILIDPTTKTAFGVQYFKDGEYHIAQASKEVIVSAGAFGSPQLLMLSGIGPRWHLEELGIPVIEDLQVGENLYDHMSLYGTTFTVNESITIPYDETSNSDQPMEDFLNGKGILTTLTGTEALGIVKTPYSDDPDPLYPDVELIYIGSSSNTGNGTAFKEIVGVNDDIYDVIWGQIAGITAGTILPMLYHPKSKGYLRLQSTDPFQYPKFYGNYFTDPNNDDANTLISAVRMIQTLVTMPAFQRYDAKLVDVVIPGCEQHVPDSDDYWECNIRHIGYSANHQVGTCKMGPNSDPDAVVSPQLQVHGISRLRVADTSIIPTPISAHTNIASFMIGEKAADMIKDYWSISR